MKKYVSVIFALHLVSMSLFAWTNGELFGLDGFRPMGRGKLAMMISGPWAWSNLMKIGINFGVAPIPGVAGNPGTPVCRSVRGLSQSL